MPKDLLNEILVYNNNMIQAIAIRENILSNLDKEEEDYLTKSVMTAAIDTLKFEQRHLQRIIDKYV